MKTRPLSTHATAGLSRRLQFALATALAATALTASGASAAHPTPTLANAADTACPTTTDNSSFASAADLRTTMEMVAGFGLRLPGSAEHARMVDYLENRLHEVDGLDVTATTRTITRWQPTTKAVGLPGRDISKAGGLTLVRQHPRGKNIDIRTAGAIPDSSPTRPAGIKGQLVYLAPDQPITAANSRGKIVIRDVVYPSIPYLGFSLLSHYLSPDLQSDLSGNYERPFLAAQMYDDMAAADRAGAAGVVQAWNVPGWQVSGYYDPHQGSLFDEPGVWVGVDQANRLKKMAAKKRQARIAVHAKIDTAPVRDLVASLPGTGSEKVVVVSHTDGNTYVQENGPVALLAIAHYLASVPAECRSRGYEFHFTSGHLRYSEESTFDLADELDDTYDDGNLAYVWAVEHLGTRRVVPIDRANGPGQQLKLLSTGEDYAWFAGGESPTLSGALVTAVKNHPMDRTAVLRGLGTPIIGQVPSICSFGGLGNTFHDRLIPTLAGISGPWSLWAPGFGERAVDFTRMRGQAMVVTDTLLALDKISKTDIAGKYVDERNQRAAGAPTCETGAPPTEID